MAIDPVELAPLRNSAEYDGTEQVLKEVFIRLFELYLRGDERDLNVSGAAHLGSINLLQKRIKQDGLAVFGNDTNAVRYLYRAWNARNPKRGLLFLKTYLQLLWPDGWVVEQMWHPKNEEYPTALVARGMIQDADPEENYYLTSRIVVSIDDENESGVSIPRVAPALRSALAARFVVELKLLKRAETTLALAQKMYGETVSFNHGQARMIFPSGDDLGLSQASYLETVAFSVGRALLSAEGKTPPDQSSPYVLKLAQEVLEWIATYPREYLSYLAWALAVQPYDESWDDVTKMAAILDRAMDILTIDEESIDKLHTLLHTTMPTPGYWN